MCYLEVLSNANFLIFNTIVDCLRHFTTRLAALCVDILFCAEIHSNRGKFIAHFWYSVMSCSRNQVHILSILFFANGIIAPPTPNAIHVYNDKVNWLPVTMPIIQLYYS